VTQVFSKAPPQLPVDPNLAASEQAAQDANVAALQQQAQGDTASLMARYGARLALAGTGGTSALTGGLTPAPGKA
jgi:hypothetical protein